MIGFILSTLDFVLGVADVLLELASVQECLLIPTAYCVFWRESIDVFRMLDCIRMQDQALGWREICNKMRISERNISTTVGRWRGCVGGLLEKLPNLEVVERYRHSVWIWVHFAVASVAWGQQLIQDRIVYLDCMRRDGVRSTKVVFLSCGCVFVLMIE